jgi:hypothetical protein
MPDDIESHQPKSNDEQWCENADSKLAADARYAADAERSMTLWQGIKTYRKAVGWSVLISAATTMDGYDTGFLTSLLGLVCGHLTVSVMKRVANCFLSQHFARHSGFISTAAT